MEMLRNALASCLFWCRINRVLVTVAGIFWSISFLLALVWPLPDLGEVKTTQLSDSSESRDITMLQPEDLSAFLKNRRWGVSLEEIIEQSTTLDKRSVNPVLREMGYVGLISSLDSNEVVLLMPEGGTQRLTIGDSLPDGRELVAIEQNSITLKDAQQNTEVLVLFPELPPEMPIDPAKMDDAADKPPQDL